ncbi:D-alanyl-D-alanine carboxypeptidase, partial [Bergeyella zoohelcum]|uniref:D-alanyl-D-alanine carboxypeptidase n=1 Tax=Bergeyella zoohelcum TaxID=1015 RepID=UPI002A9128E5
MKVFFLVTIGISLSISAQTNLQNRLNKEVQKFLSTPKGKVSSLSYFVADEKGNTIYNYQREKGLTTASTQKIFTAATAMELLSPSYTYTTSIFTSGDIINQELYGDLILRGSG